MRRRSPHSSKSQRLELDYLDLYLLHWPLAGEFDKTVASYRALERLLGDGRVRSIGVSNFMPEHLRALLSSVRRRAGGQPGRTAPLFHTIRNPRGERPARYRDAVLGAHRRHLQSQTAGATRCSDTSAEAPRYRGTGRKYGKTPAQVIIRWHLDHGFSVIPKSVNSGRILANFGVFDFKLGRADLDRIDALDTGRRAGPDPRTFKIGTFEVDVDAQ